MKKIIMLLSVLVAAQSAFADTVIRCVDYYGKSYRVALDVKEVAYYGQDKDDFNYYGNVQVTQNVEQKITTVTVPAFVLKINAKNGDSRLIGELTADQKITDLLCQKSNN